MDDKNFDAETAQEWISLVEKSKSRDIDIHPRLKAWTEQVSPPMILEIGSGQGICSGVIDLTGRHYTGVEPSQALLARAKKLYPESNREFIQGNAYALPCETEGFDAAFSVLVWHLLGDLQTAAKELSRVLKSGGRFLVMTANPDSYENWMAFYTQTTLAGKRFEGRFELNPGCLSRDVLYFHTLAEITESFQAADLQVEATDTFRSSEQTNGRNYLISLQGHKLRKDR